MTATVLQYKGYSARVDYSPEDACLVGRVLDIGDIIDCEGGTMDEVEKDFHNAVDSYLDACKTWGKKPDTPDCADLHIELPSAVYARLSQSAETSGQHIDQLAVEAILAAYPAKRTRVKAKAGVAASRAGLRRGGGKKAKSQSARLKTLAR